MAMRQGLLVGVLAAAGLLGTPWGAASGEPVSPGTYLFDTGTPSAQPLTPAALRAQQNWKRLPEGDLKHSFRGDAVVLNDQVGAVVRAKGTGVEMFSTSAAGGDARVTILLLRGLGATPAALSSLRIVENNPGVVTLAAAWQSGDGSPLSLTCHLAAGQNTLEVRPTAGIDRLRLQVPSRYVVVPDFFGADMVFTADRLRRSRIALPSENFYLTPIDPGRALLMCVWPSSRQTAEAIVADAGPEAGFAGCEVECLANQTIWLALIAGAGVWHDQRLAADATPAKCILDWKPPFPAKWRADLVGPAGQTQSEYFRGAPGSEEGLPPAAAAGYECHFQEGQAVVERTMAADATGDKQPPPSLLVYPLDRTRATPLTAFCPIDVLRNTLGVGPCQYILQTEGLQSDANPTPDNVMTWIEKQISRKRQRKSAEEIWKLLQEMSRHFSRAGQRLQRYADLARDVRKLCSEDEAGGSPTAALLGPIADELQRTATDAALATADQRASQLMAQVARLIERPDPLAECQRLGVELRSLGAAQDRALATSRMTARWLRARAQMAAADKPDESVDALARQVRILVDATLYAKP